ncbi:hypothetical protein OO012_19110 [Rhodobacteraceae bacterium KMM 6894]|nr:hypothetical protein [Rhodobacteraceae bacterium KMM 6894]
MLRRVGLIVGLTIVVVGLIASFAGYRPGPRPEALEARIAVINPVIAAVNTAQAHATQCIAWFSELTDTQLPPAEAQSRMARTQRCGQTARATAEAGYGTLDQVSIGPDSPTKAQFLDAAATALSIYEMQGDDFDTAQTLLGDAMTQGTPLTDMRTTVLDQLATLASDLVASHDALNQTRADYYVNGT